MRIFCFIYLFGAFSPRLVSLSAADFDLAVSADAGYETGVYDPADSAYEESALIAPAAEAGLHWRMGPRWRGESSLRLSDDAYFSAAGNWTAEGGFRAVRSMQKGDFRLGLSTGYFSQPGAIDPDQPQDYLLSVFSAEFRLKSKAELRLGNALSALNETGGRNDLRDKVRLRLHFRPTPWLFPSIGLGAGGNASSVPGYRYTDVEMLAQASAAAGEKTMFTALLNLGRRFYGEGSQPNSAGGLPPGLGKKVKNNNAGGGATVDIASVMFACSRDLTGHLEMSFQYLFWMFAPQAGPGGRTTHRATLGAAWRLNPL